MPPCAQGGGGHEDCLYLNVYTPAATPQQCSNYPGLLPVFVQFFGGGLMGGYPDDPKDIVAGQYPAVWVMVNYRLNAFGWLALEVLSKNSSTGAYTSGNYGLSDQNLSLQWVNMNIKNFCGDPNRVTIFGQSSGGTSVFGHLVSRFSSNLFHRAISMSGSPLLMTNLSLAERQNLAFIHRSKCKDLPNPSTELLDCLYSLSLKEVSQAVPGNVYPFWDDNEDFDLPTWGYISGGIIIMDGYFIQNSYTTDPVNLVPTIIGTGAQEIDLDPVAIIAGHTWPQYRQYINERFAGFLNGTQLSAKIQSMYTEQNVELGTLTPQQAYESIATDIGVGCGNTYVAQVLANKGAQVYRYVFNRGPEIPICPNPCCNNPNLCLQYAYHTWDQNNWLHPTKNTSSLDWKFGEILKKAFYDLADKGEVNGWQQVSRNSYPEVNLVNGSGVFWDKQYRQEQCTFFQEPFMDYWWEN